MNAQSLFSNYKALTMSEPVPTLERTSGEIRDRAVAESNVLRQENAELRQALRLVLKESDEDVPHCIRKWPAVVRALLAKVRP